MATIRHNQMEVIEMSSVFYWLISRLDTEKKKISALKDLSIEFKNEIFLKRRDRQRQKQKKTIKTYIEQIQMI